MDCFIFKTEIITRITDYITEELASWAIVWRDNVPDKSFDYINVCE